MSLSGRVGSALVASTRRMTGTRSVGRAAMRYSPLRDLAGSLRRETVRLSFSVASRKDSMASARNSSRWNCFSMFETSIERPVMEFLRSCETIAEMRMNDWNWRDSASRAISSRSRSVMRLSSRPARASRRCG